MNFHVLKDRYFIKARHLITFGVKEDTIKSWRKSSRCVGDWICINGEWFIAYDSMPAPTQKLIGPINSVLKLFKAEQEREQLRAALNTAKAVHYTKYKPIYEADPSLTAEQVTRFAQRHAVFQCIIDMKQKEGLRDLENLFAAYNLVFDKGKGYKSKHAFSNAIRKAGANGIESMALDSRIYGNNQLAKKESTPEIKFLVATLAASPRKFSNTQILEVANNFFAEKGFPQKSLSWVKQHRREWLQNNSEVYKSRYGMKEAQKKMPFASLEHAEFVGGAWLMDGKTLAFWGPEFQRYCLVFIIDSCSKKIVGCSFGKTENTAVIMNALKNAIENTGVLPNELIMDNHSFTNTPESKILQNLFSKKGATITVTSNPQYKSIIERYNQYIDKLCSKYFGYLGEGIRSKSIEARPSDETLELYGKNFLTEEQIRNIAYEVVETYNQTPLKGGKTPNEQYILNPSPYPVLVTNFDKADLFNIQVEKKISRGQITIMRGVVKHEFQLSANLFAAYNDKTVMVKYQDLKDGIYLYQLHNGQPIAYIEPKGKIHMAKIDQTESDIDALHRNAGRTKGIISQSKKVLETLTIQALAIDPEISERINRLTAPKELVQQYQQITDAHYYGSETETVKMQLLPTTKMQVMGTSSLRPKEPKKDKPFTDKNHQIGMVDPSKYFEDDED